MGFTAKVKIKQMNTEVKLFHNPNYVIENGKQIRLNVEQQMNEFMKGKDIIDIKVSSAYDTGYEETTDTIIVVYKVEEEV